MTERNRAMTLRKLFDRMGPEIELYMDVPLEVILRDPYGKTDVAFISDDWPHRSREGATTEQAWFRFDAFIKSGLTRRKAA